MKEIKKILRAKLKNLKFFTLSETKKKNKNQIIERARKFKNKI